MGITGLLPALKSIQVTKHLSEFAGQTLAVDAYVWLHRGVMACATELATGKKTHKYVDYAMHRVRLLRHHGIEPYIVFDGGPLPAKKGTEVERKQRREEFLERGNALAAQGNHSQARDYYLKCVDVTPQMAFQFIKALRAESVPYVVAPYEADAQMAYLERVGLVDGILTEDSDLLVFGCRQVLFKLDIVTNTVVSITRKDFASVSTPKSDISLVGWSDVQFRAMAILSGCDYLPSIPGIGLKTACTMLRKWKTAEQVVRAVLLEGKKTVPRRYLEQFKLAEKCFLHQRVYCPNQEKLVYLTEVDSEWNDEADAYVGGNLEPSLAKKLAVGDIDPITLLPMQDINPQFIPRVKTIFQETNQKDKGKGKATDIPAKEGILSFFGPNLIIPPREKRCSTTPIPAKKGVAGKASGKRTLADVMDSEIVVKKQKQKSRFFDSLMPASKNVLQAGTLVSTASPSRERENKENICTLVDKDESEIDSNLSVETQGEVDTDMEIDIEDASCQAVVEQEEGYISPTPSYSGDIQDLSSPVRIRHTPVRGHAANSGDLEFDVEAVSSPPSHIKGLQQSISGPQTVHRTRSLDLHPIHKPGRRHDNFHHSRHSAYLKARSPRCMSFPGPDLRNTFDDDRSSEIDCSDNEQRQPERVSSPPAQSPSPLTPVIQEAAFAANDDFPDLQDVITKENEEREHVVAIGWREKWALNSSAGKFKELKLLRRETNITPTGRHTISHPDSQLRPCSRVVQRSAVKTASVIKPKRTQSRQSLPFFGPPNKGSLHSEYVDGFGSRSFWF